MGISCMTAIGVGLLRQSGDAVPKPILSGIELSFSAAEVAALVGPTGAGKSSLLHLLGGLLRPSEGEIRADDEAISRWTAAHRDRWRRKVGILFQNAELIGDLSAGENVLLPLLPRRGTLAAKEAEVRRVLDLLEASAFTHQPARELSGGERQRVALARALVMEPELLLLDEPTAHQDNVHAELVLAAIRAAKARGAVVVLASHDPRIVQAGVSDRIHHLSGGVLVGAPNGDGNGDGDGDGDRHGSEQPGGESGR